MVSSKSRHVTRSSFFFTLAHEIFVRSIRQCLKKFHVMVIKTSYQFKLIFPVNWVSGRYFSPIDLLKSGNDLLKSRKNSSNKYGQGDEVT